MSIGSTLRMQREDKLIEYALWFAEDIEPKLLEASKEGYTGFNIDLEYRKDSHILKDIIFLENLETLLDGCKVSIKETEYTNLLFENKYYKYELNVSWK